MLARVTLLALSLLLLAGAGVAHAHDVQVEQPGPIELNLASGEREVLVHGTLVKQGDTARITFAAPVEDAWGVQLLVPDRLPEREAKEGELPSVQLEYTPAFTAAPLTGPTTTIVAGKLGDAVVDAGTRVRYRTIASGEELQLASRAYTTITVIRGSEPIRIALRIAALESDAGFETLDPERTPRTMARLLQWDNTPAPGATVRRAAPERRSLMSPEVWLPAGIALVMLAAAIWWVRRGRGRARVRGFERRSEEQKLP
ncbi:MAG: hypothetical protein JWM25_1028 [Thermoleophilia bacterium]|nr:hypothetical protein [Thermoleophilia bacterium]MCZ4496445.1 hypothetical protein [Thermoleophilia bacterium]